jgi:hypothetical protein
MPGEKSQHGHWFNSNASFPAKFREFDPDDTPRNQRAETDIYAILFSPFG